MQITYFQLNPTATLHFPVITNKVILVSKFLNMYVNSLHLILKLFTLCNGKHYGDAQLTRNKKDDSSMDHGSSPYDH